MPHKRPSMLMLARCSTWSSESELAAGPCICLHYSSLLPPNKFLPLLCILTPQDQKKASRLVLTGEWGRGAGGQTLRAPALLPYISYYRCPACD